MSLTGYISFDFAGLGKIANLESVTTGDTKMMVVSKTETTTKQEALNLKSTKKKSNILEYLNNCEDKELSYII